jgi:hypothetical protein
MAERSAKTEWRRPGVLVGSATVVAVGGKILLVWLSDMVFAPPIVALAIWLGFWKAFLLSALLYGVGSYAFALLAVRAVDRLLRGEPSRFAAFLARHRQSFRGRQAQRLLVPGGLVGLTLSSVLVGGIVTSALWYYAGARSHVRAVAAYSSLVFALSFAAFYAGNAAALF